ncbi:hypothetical protein MRX96_037359 [Rhipicephalus microplus]
MRRLPPRQGEYPTVRGSVVVALFFARAPGDSAVDAAVWQTPWAEEEEVGARLRPATQRVLCVCASTAGHNTSSSNNRASQRRTRLQEKSVQCYGRQANVSGVKHTALTQNVVSRLVGARCTANAYVQVRRHVTIRDSGQSRETLVACSESRKLGGPYRGIYCAARIYRVKLLPRRKETDANAFSVRACRFYEHPLSLSLLAAKRGDFGGTGKGGARVPHTTVRSVL